jgi:hypothetical protein
MLVHVLPPAYVVWALVVEAGELERCFEACGLGKLERLELLAAVLALKG